MIGCEQFLFPKLVQFEVEGEQEQVPVAYRYNIHPVTSLRTNVFRANPLQQTSEIKFNNMGASWVGKWEQLPESKIVDVLWEAAGLVQTGGGLIELGGFEALPRVQ